MDKSLNKKKVISIFMLIDALGWTYMKDADFMKDEAVVRKPVKSILGFSSAAIPTILSGKMPEEHGFWSLFLRSEDGSPFRWTRNVNTLMRFVPTRLARKVVEEISRKYHGYTGYFETYKIPLKELPNYDISERRSIYVPGGLESVPSIFDLWEDANIPYESYCYKNGSDMELFDKATETLKKGECRALFLYFAEVDAFLHQHCNDDKAFTRKLSDYEKKIKDLLRVAKEGYDEVRWFVFSDHGMTPTTETHDLMKKVAEFGLTEAVDYKVFYDSTMARFWFMNDDAKATITKNLAKFKFGKWLTDDDKAQLGLRFKDNRYGDEVFIMNPGVIIEPCYMGDTAPKGMHGFHPDDKHADASFFTNVKDVYDPKIITDFFNVMKVDTLGL
jgi:predicted AlkP superfamily pyrophosphatase or phosphodiesterase